MSAEQQQQQANVYFLFDSENNTITRIPAHRSVLAATSDVFKAMLYDRFKDFDDFYVTNVSVAVFKEFLKFFYQNKVKLSMENVSDLLYLGHKYKVKKCMDDCMQLLIGIIDVENVCSTFKLGIFYKLSELIKKCETFIIVNSQAVLRSADFLACNRDVMTRILKLNVLSCTEYQLFKACMLWVNVKSNQAILTKNIVDTHLGDLFYQIRFQSMKYHELCALVAKYRLVLKNDFTTITNMISQPGSPSGKFNPLPRHFKWNRHAIIKCDRVLDIQFKRNFDFQHIEETSFLTNQPLILFSFKCCETSSSHVRINVKAREIQMSGGSSNAKTLVEMKDAILQSMGMIVLQHPILIRPGFFYTISIEKCSNAQVFYSNELHTKMLLDSDVSIEFHNYSTCKESGKTVGLISALYFNRI